MAKFSKLKQKLLDAMDNVCGSAIPALLGRLPGVTTGDTDFEVRTRNEKRNGLHGFSLVLLFDKLSSDLS